MHSFQPSRGRILFEVFCALAVVASMVGAWRQTDASALLTAAAAAALYAMVRLFDLGRDHPAQVEEPQRIEPEPEAKDAVPAAPVAQMPLAAVEPPPVPEAGSEELEPVKPAARTSSGRRKGGARKGGGRRASVPKAAKVIESAPVEQPEPAPLEEVVPPAHLEEPEVAGTPVSEEVDIVMPGFPAEPAHVPHVPLFEPEPFVRMPRQAFGRRGRI